MVLSALLYWGLSCLALVGPSEMGVRENFGVVNGRLGPGLHWKLPYPWGYVRRFPVKRIDSMPIGFVAEEGRPVAYLWSKAHAQEEFALVLGSGTEVVAVDALVYHKIREDPNGLLDYAYHSQNPEDALEGYGYRALMELTRNATLEQVLSVNRAEFARRLERSIQRYAEQNRLGIEVVDVALVNLHPPVAAADAYLDVISAGIDAAGYWAKAVGEKDARIQEAEGERGKAVAEAKVRAARRVGVASEESAEFVAVGQAFAVAPDAFKLRTRGDTIAEILGDKPLTLVDPAFAGDQGAMLLDLRPDRRRGDPATEGMP
jgi:regulator of protease activity HflC (stomatin/prohibitin superfamily)